MLIGDLPDPDMSSNISNNVAGGIQWGLTFHMETVLLQNWYKYFLQTKRILDKEIDSTFSLDI